MSPEMLLSLGVDTAKKPSVVLNEGGFLVIEYGSKTLELGFDLKGKHRGFGRAWTKVDTIGGRSRLEGETTVLYQFALLLMREVAIDHGVLIKYVFSTSNPTMKAWALHPEKGLGVFSWDKVKNGRKKFEAYKVISSESPG